jgi:hypothetical protein
MNEAAQLLHTLTQPGDAAPALHWLTAVEAGRQVVPPDFAWDQLAEAATQAAQHPAGSVANALQWAAVGIRAYDYLATHDIRTWGSPSRNRVLALGLRVDMILAHGSVAGHPILDAAQLLEEFMAGVEYAPAYAVAMVRGQVWDRPENEEWPYLFALAKALPRIETLVPAGYLPRTPQLQEWFAVAPILAAELQFPALVDAWGFPW